MTYSLVLTRYGDLNIYHSSHTPSIQLKWIKETYDTVRISLHQSTGISLTHANVYLLDEAQYIEILSEVVGIDLHPEWTQGVAYRPDTSYDGVVYINKVMSALWTTSTSEKEKHVWRGENVEKTTRKVAAHELTHLALMPYDIPSWLNEGLAQLFEQGQLDSDSLRLDRPDPKALKRLQHDLRGKRPLRLADLLRARQEAFLVMHGPGRTSSSRHYLYSWGVVYYLTVHRSLLTRQALDQYVDRRADRPDPIKRFERLVGMPLAKFEREWRAEMLAL